MPDEIQLPPDRSEDAASDTPAAGATAPSAPTAATPPPAEQSGETTSGDSTAISIGLLGAAETEETAAGACGASPAVASVAEDAPAEIPAMALFPPAEGAARPAEAPPAPPAGTVTTTTTVTTSPAAPRRKVRPTIFKQDMTAPALSGLDWSPEAADGSLERVKLHLTADAREAIEWYSESKRSKRGAAMTVRVVAVLTTALAAVVPLIAQMAQGNTSPVAALRDLQLVIQEPALTAVLLAVAGAALALDKFFGFSTGWVRFIKAGQQLRDSMEDFELEWETQRASRGGMEPTPQEVASALALARTFSGKMNGIVQDETNTWIQEFQASMQAVQEAVGSARTTAQQRADAAAATEAARSTASALAVVNLTVTNGADCAPDGWTVTVDDELPRRAAGNQVAVPGVRPGARTFKVSGVADGKPVQASFALQVQPGSITQATTTLA